MTPNSYSNSCNIQFIFSFYWLTNSIMCSVTIESFVSIMIMTELFTIFFATSCTVRNTDFFLNIRFFYIYTYLFAHSRNKIINL